MTNVNQPQDLNENFSETAPENQIDVDQRARSKKVGGEQSNGEDALVNSEGEVSGYESAEKGSNEESNS